MKLFIILTLFFASSAFAQVFEHEKLQKYVGYRSLYEHPKINRIQLDFLQYYADKDGPWHHDVNEYLRTGFWYGWIPEELDQSIASIDALLETTPKLPQNIVLFRGQNMSFLGRHYSIGEEFVDNTFFSGSSDIRVARYYSGFNRHSFVMVLYFEGQKGRGLILNNNDKEVLLARNLKFRIMDSVKGNTRRYGLVQICQKSGCKRKVSSKKILRWWKDYKKNHLTEDHYEDIPWDASI